MRHLEGELLLLPMLDFGAQRGSPLFRLNCALSLSVYSRARWRESKRCLDPLMGQARAHIFQRMGQRRRMHTLLAASLLLWAVTLHRQPEDAVISYSVEKRTSSGLLVAQYTHNGTQNNAYHKLLQATQPINQLYAQKWGFDYLCLDNPPVPRRVTDERPSRATYFKLFVLEYALDRYDQLLLLDSDAVVSDFAYNIRTLLPDDDTLIVAHLVEERPDKVNINAGVTLWNLRHESAHDVWMQWWDICKQRMMHGLTDDDQGPLQHVLMGHQKSVRALTTPEFAYGKGTVVKHFIRMENTWETSEQDLERRLSIIRERVWDSVCSENECPPFPF